MNFHPITQAFRNGSEAFRLGQSREMNPHGQPVKVRPPHDWNAPSAVSLAFEWDRGYRNTRKQARFDATIAARMAVR